MLRQSITNEESSIRHGTGKEGSNDHDSEGVMKICTNIVISRWKWKARDSSWSSHASSSLSLFTPTSKLARFEMVTVAFKTFSADDVVIMDEGLSLNYSPEVVPLARKFCYGRLFSCFESRDNLDSPVGEPNSTISSRKAQRRDR